ncbi:hypothetical protein [Paraburkholderia phenoliruptrix]|uniref:hypothetical protein n=1 Tax=Paraburkholderia phenoliruptrix TaxID=252970 RepID=UPI00285A55AE|nr:hypothetical protein [Paraburkholderia phenoliruptrix]MDR6389204.1 hypothetical protein [Paraburkholderia phenoliruptrix]
MIDIDEIERIAKAGDPWGYAATPANVLALIAEVRALRAKLETPVFTAGPYGEGLLGLEGANPITATQVFMHTPWPVTVFYGDKKIYTSMAAFLEAHPEKQPWSA